MLVLDALGFRDRKGTDVLQLICSVSLIAKRSGFSRTRTTTSILESRGFFGCDIDTVARAKPSKIEFLQAPQCQEDAPGVYGEHEDDSSNSELRLKSAGLAT